LVLAVVDRAASAVELVVAGHPWPVLIDPAGRPSSSPRPAGGCWDCPVRPTDPSRAR
jgi:hypothetical protein